MAILRFPRALTLRSCTLFGRCSNMRAHVQDPESKDLQLRVRELTEALEVCAAQMFLSDACVFPSITAKAAVSVVLADEWLPLRYESAVMLNRATTYSRSGRTKGAALAGTRAKLAEGSPARYKSLPSKAGVAVYMLLRFQPLILTAQDQHHAHEAELSGLQVELQRGLARAEAAEAEVAARPPAEELRC